MAFELFERSYTRNGEPFSGIVLTQSRYFSIGVDVWEALGRPELVLLYYDRERRLVGIRATDAVGRAAHNVRRSKDRPHASLQIHAQGFVSHYHLEQTERHLLPWHKDGEMVVAGPVPLKESSPPAEPARPAPVVAPRREPAPTLHREASEQREGVRSYPDLEGLRAQPPNPDQVRDIIRKATL